MKKPTNELLPEYLDHWLDARASDAQRGVITHRTLMRYQSVVRCHLQPLLIGVHVRDFDEEQVRDLFHLLGAHRLAVNTQKGVKNVLSAVCRTAIQEKRRTTNPVELAHIRFGRAEVGKPFTALDQQAFFNAAPSACRFMSLYTLKVLTGARIAELLGTQWPQLDLVRAELRLESQWCRDTHRLEPLKNKKARRVDLCPRAVAAFQRIPHTGPFIWGSPKMEYLQPLSYEVLRRDFRGGLLAAGLARRGYTMHALRHTYATRLLELPGVQLHYVSEQLGHGSLEITRNLYGRTARAPRPDVLAQMTERGFGG
jgi:integrase